MLLPLTWLILYQDEPETPSPAQVALQLPPETVPITVTLVPADRLAFFVAPVEGLVRTLTPSQAAFL